MSPEEFVKAALAEDIGDGDHSALACIASDARGKARMLFKEDGVIAGLNWAPLIFNELDKNSRVTSWVTDGDAIKKGTVVLEVEASTHALLAGERLILNIMQRMSGIATRTRAMVNLVEGTGTRILDTRKTTPLLRFMEKEAVRIGGGYNHRFGLYDMIMLKDNHIDFAGGIQPAIERTVAYLEKVGKNLKIEVETRNLEEVQQVLAVGKVDRIMLDNFDIPTLKQAVALIDKRYETEASGGITEETLRAYAETGVDFISIGALTHAIKSLDISLKAIA